MKSLGDAPPPTWRSRVENALYSEAKWPADQVNWFMDQLRQEYAHELAEKIRAQRNESHEVVCVPCLIYTQAADLIDPQKEGQ